MPRVPDQSMYQDFVLIFWPHSRPRPALQAYHMLLLCHTSQYQSFLLICSLSHAADIYEDVGSLYYNPYFSFPDCNCCLSHCNIYGSNHKLRKYMYPEHHKPDTPGNCHYALLSLRLTLKACTLCTALVWCTVFLDANLIGHAAIVVIVLTLCCITVHICLLVNS